jgi:predicted nuclease of predicted toxin-antitoxin system
MKLLIDMNLRPAWAAFLAQYAIEAIHWSSVGLATASDETIMAYAKANDYTVLTSDLDFAAILAATGGGKPSVIIIRALDARPERTGNMVVSAVNAAASDLERGALLIVEAARSRIRLLPLL